MSRALVKASDGDVVTILEEHDQLLHSVREKLRDLTGSEIIAMDIMARMEAAIIDTLGAAQVKPRQRQGLFTLALNQFLVDPVAGDE